MSRYTGPRLRIMRRLGVALPGLSGKSPERRPQPPGQHGANKRRKISDYALHLMEKQKLRYHYGLTERQLRRAVAEASAGTGESGARLAEFLERRLDNLVFRAGFAPTIPAARQLVRHGHILLDGRRADIPSMRVARGAVVSVRERSRSIPLFADGERQAQAGLIPPWLTVDRPGFTARLADLPDQAAIPFPIELRLVIEFYAR